jgi:predicted AAA+ superfamily ATPase
MAISNRDRVAKAMDLLAEGLKPYVEREFLAKHGKSWPTEVTKGWQYDLTWNDDNTPHLDVTALMRLMWEQWNEVFRNTLGHAERSLISELRETRNRWAHQKPFTSDDAYRALDSVERLLTAVSATTQAAELASMKQEVLRIRYQEEARNELRKSTGTVNSPVTGTLKPWREVITPHRDVASGKYMQAEFAADLWQVHLGEGSDEYRMPSEFFRRTYLTDSLKQLLVSALLRLTGNGGDPVVQLQTNFGGGKTHSMLALYHLFSGANAGDLLGIDAVISAAYGNQVPTGQPLLPTARRVVLVGNKISPGNPVQKPDGTLVRTLWGELAWQLGGRAAYDRIRLDDENATNPGDVLRELFNDYGPCLILIDEWVAYARQLHDHSDLPAGSFETQFSFAQALTESAKLAKNCLLVISLPASDTSGNEHNTVDDVEVGGVRGREALDRLRNVIGRVESSWRPASAEEGFEIVRRRLFEPLTSNEQFKQRDVIAQTYADFYRQHASEFPPEVTQSSYEQRIKAAYPIHPEVFDRLYTDWSTLVKFQRTRGVLRLMAAVIYDLWKNNDLNPLIMPGNIPIDEIRVETELTRYLSDNWKPIIEKDVDGPNSLPLQIDNNNSNLGKHAAARRVARTIYLGSAPIAAASNMGMEDRRIKLGCVMPNESPAIFGDALRRLASEATYLYQDGARYWYSTQPTVTKIAEDLSEQYKREPDRVHSELQKRLNNDLKTPGEFGRIHPLPSSSIDVLDDNETRLVVLDLDQAYSKGSDNAAESAARNILEMRGNAPRLYRNALVFLAADKTRINELEEALRKYLAWQTILDNKEQHNLSPNQVRQAQTQLDNANSTLKTRLPEVYSWLLVPDQKEPTEPVTWQTLRLSGQDPLAVRVSKKLRHEELLLDAIAPSILKLVLDKVPLWTGNHVAIRQLVDYFGRYHYLPRLTKPNVLLESIQNGLNSLTWDVETFAYAESYDETEQRYRGLSAGILRNIHASDSGLLVKPNIAKQQLDAEAAARAQQAASYTVNNNIAETSQANVVASSSAPNYQSVPASSIAKPAAPQHTRYYGSIELNPTRVGRDASLIADEVIAHLVALLGANVKITLEIEGNFSGDVPDNVQRTVKENGNSLKFTVNEFVKD